MGDMIRCPRYSTYHYRNDPCVEENVPDWQIKLDALEKLLVSLCDKCAVTSGLPAFPYWDKKRSECLTKISEYRMLTEMELIQQANPDASRN